MKHMIYHSPIGILRITASDNGISGLTLPTQKHREPAVEERNPHNTLYKQIVDWLDAYFAHENPSINDLPLAPPGTAFQKAVWDRLCRIPYGQVITYGQIALDIAHLLGRERMSAQAIGQAVGANPIPIIIPCHRVIGADGTLTGYAGGIPVKQWLLQHEGVIL